MQRLANNFTQNEMANCCRKNCIKWSFFRACVRVIGIVGGCVVFLRVGFYVLLELAWGPSTESIPVLILYVLINGTWFYGLLRYKPIYMFVYLGLCVHLAGRLYAAQATEDNLRIRPRNDSSENLIFYMYTILVLCCFDAISYEALTRVNQSGGSQFVATTQVIHTRDYIATATGPNDPWNHNV